MNTCTVYRQTDGSDPEELANFPRDEAGIEAAMAYVRERVVDDLTNSMEPWASNLDSASPSEILAAGNTSREEGCAIMWAE